MTLTAEQFQAVSCENNLFLNACPGSGKTRVIISKLAKELDIVRNTSRSIACITYTNTAVYEIENRLAQIVSDADSRYFQISTIHSFCLNNIFRPYCWKIPAYKSGFKILTRDTPDFERLVGIIYDAHNLKPQYRDYDDFYSLARNANGDPAGAAIKSNIIVEKSARDFWTLCEKGGYIDFSNILYHSLILLRNNPFIADGLAARFAWILVDEFQDTNDIQTDILRLINDRQHTKFFLVGDLNQSVFRFADANPELATKFATDIKADCSFSLSANFRSSSPIINHAELVFPRSPGMIAKGEARSFTELPTYHHVADPFHAITDYFIPHLKALGIPLGKAAVLAPWWNHVYPLAKKLSAFGIPVVGPGARPYKRSRLFAGLAEQLCSYLASPNPKLISSIERSLFNALLDLTNKPKFEIFSYNGRRVVMEILAALSNYTGGESAVKWLEKSSLLVGDILVKNDLLDPAYHSSFYVSVQEMKSDIINSAKADLSNFSVDDLGLFGDSEVALRLSTIHNSKGREYTAVALINLHEGQLPDFRNLTPEEFAESKRLFYVGLTRAERILYYITDHSHHKNIPSRYLGVDGVRVLQV